MKHCVPLMLLLGLAALPAVAQTITVGYQQTVQLQVPGATAAYSLNTFYADAGVAEGVVVIQGNNPGSTTIMVITSVGIQSYRVAIPQPAPVYPPGFEPPQEWRTAENGSYEIRYASDPSQLQNNFDFSRRQGDRTVRLHVSNVNYLGDSVSGSAVGFPSLSYEIATPRRDLTFVDQIVTNSPLTLDNVLVRGFHAREGDWFFHGGYTAQAMFQNLFLPTQREAVFGLGYRFHLGKHTTLTPNLYYFGTKSDSLYTGHPGTLGTLALRHEVNDDLTLLTEVGYGGGLGFAGQVRYSRDPDEHLYETLRYESRSFHSVSVNDLHGLLAEFRWDRKLGRKTNSSVVVSGNQYDLPHLNRQINVSAGWTLDRQFSTHWSGVGGLVYSRFSGATGFDDFQNFQIPVGVNFSSNHFGAGFLYRGSHSNQGGVGQGYRASVSGRARDWQLSTYLDRQTQVPTVAVIFSSIPGLQQELDRLGISATTPQQVSDLLRNEAVLLSLGFINGLNLNLSPVLLQTGATLNWLPKSPSHQQLYLSVLYNRNEMPASTQQSMIYSAAYSRKITRSNSVFASYSMFRSKSAASPSEYHPLFEISLRHNFNVVPWFLTPGRTGTISGIVFQDSQLQGTFHEEMPRLAGVEVVLDGTRRAVTDAHGHYSFSRLSYGSHRVEALFHSDRPFFFSTQSLVTAEVDSTINFGVVFTRGRLIGHVQNDAGVGIMGAAVNIVGPQRTSAAIADGEGKFMVADLEAGSYRIELKPESLPMGYLPDGLEPVTVNVDLGSPAEATLTAKAIRTVAGRVRAFDRVTKREVYLSGIKVRLVELGLESMTDEAGNYLFRALPAGSFTLSVTYEDKEFKLGVTLPPGPAFSKGNDIYVGVR